MAEVNQEQLLKQIFNFALSLKQQGKSKVEIKNALIEKGLSEEASRKVIDSLDTYNANTRNRATHSNEKEGGGLGWLLWIGILVIVNILSAAFDWGFWVY